MDTDQVWAIAMVKDEEDIILETLTHIAGEGVDGIAVMDNASSDGTLELLHEARSQLLCPIWIYEEPEIGYFQSARMTWLANIVAKEGASWVIPFDADEIWYCREDRIATYLRGLPDTTLAVGARLWNHFVTSFDEPGNPFTAMAYRDSKSGALPKVAFRPVGEFTVAAGNHGVFMKDPDTGENVLFQPDLSHNQALDIRHFPYRSFDQFLHKVINGGKAYEATDLPKDVGAHWREYYAIWKNGGDDALRELFEEWYYFTAPVTSGLVDDPAPFCRWAS